MEREQKKKERSGREQRKDGDKESRQKDKRIKETGSKDERLETGEKNKFKIKTKVWEVKPRGQRLNDNTRKNKEVILLERTF